MLVFFLPREVCKTLRAAAFIAEPLHVDLGNQQAALKPFLRQKGSIFGNQLMRAEHYIGRGLPFPRAGVHISAQKFCRLHSHQLTAVLVLANEIVAGGEISNHGGPGLRHFHRGRIRRPQVFADFKAQHQTGNFCAGKSLQGPKAHILLPTERNKITLCRRRCKLALFVKLAVIWQMRLRDDS